MITIIYQFKHNITWHCRINQFFSFPEQLQIWIYVFLVGDHRYIISVGPIELNADFTIGRDRYNHST